MVWLLLCAPGLACVSAHAQESGQELIRLDAPAPGRETISKKPKIRIALTVPVEPGSVHILLDGIDITRVIERTGNTLSYVPETVLPGGDHVLQVSARTSDGLDLYREFRFATRHSASFTQLASGLRVGLEAEGVAAHRDTPEPDPSYRMQGDIDYRLDAIRNRWEASIDTNLWYLNQKLDVFPPQHEGLDLASYRLHAATYSNRYAIAADAGDLQIEGTNRVLGILARRGASLQFNTRHASLSGFAVNSQQVFGFRGGTGIGTDPHANIYGLTTGIAFFDNRLRLRALHARGGEPGSSFGWFTAFGPTRGNVTGYVLTARPVPTIEIEAEYDTSEFDSNVLDDFAAQDDEAYALRVSGQKNAFNFQLAYEHLGPNYAVVASPVPRDQNNFTAAAGFNSARHAISARVAQQHDNIDDDPLRPRFGNREWALEYAFLAGERWMLGAGVRDSRVETSHEPDGFFPQETQTRGVTGRAQFAHQRWRIAAEIGLSDQDDGFFDTNDSRVLTRSFSPAYYSEHISITPFFSVNTTKFEGTGVEMEQRNLSLMLNGQLFEQRFGYGLAFAHYDQQTSDRALDMDSQSAELRLSWFIRRGLDRHPYASFNVRAAHQERRDHAFGLNTRDWTVWLTFAINPRFAF